MPSPLEYKELYELLYDWLDRVEVIKDSDFIEEIITFIKDCTETTEN